MPQPKKLIVASAVLSLCATASAQDVPLDATQGVAEPAPAPALAPATEEPERVPPPPAYQEPAPAVEGEAPLCTPTCRTGFVCLAGQCVSACNPPCAPGEQCSDGGSCIAADKAAVTDAQTPAFWGKPPAEAEPEPAPRDGPPDPSGRRHDGFMLRFTTGAGVAGGGYDTSFGEVSFGGVGVNFSVDIGAALVDDLSVHARLGYSGISDPQVRLDDEEVDSPAEEDGFGAFILGPGLTYYFMPLNIYLTGVIGLSGLSGDDGFRNDQRTRAGWAVNIDAGWEFWVSRQWALGFAVRLWLSNLPDEIDDDESVDVGFASFSPLFSITWQ